MGRRSAGRVPALRLSMDIYAPVSKVWRCLTGGKHLSRWYLPALATELRKGGKWDFGRSEKEKDVEGRVLRVVPGRRLVHSFRFVRAKDPFSRVTIDLEPFPAKGRRRHRWTRLTLTHDRFGKARDTRRWVSGGWPGMLSSLKTLVETDGLPWKGPA